MGYSNFAIRVPRGVRGVINEFIVEIIIFLRLWNRIPNFMEPILEKIKEYYGEKVTIIFPFLP
ncbi:MAG: hypothetical protein AMJ94_15740 [Deltaproteobacteria bacterium SM23_61]|nr:MAG: hypothetical protein AMJ94_15740 [Deltaproteobacteria bacterium SM23_61]